MIYYLMIDPDAQVVTIRARAEGPHGLIGDLIHDVHPGETWDGYSFEELVELGSGGHDLEPRTT